jgi:uncharacterized protein YecT (DUF1311 family)
MKNLFLTSLAFCALAIPAFVLAQSGRELYSEANAMSAEADKKLNSAYDHLIKSIRAGEGKDRADLVVERLRESQRAWLKYRDAQVAFIGTYADIGSSSARAAGMAGYSVELTEQRIRDLNEVPNPF